MPEAHRPADGFVRAEEHPSPFVEHRHRQFAVRAEHVVVLDDQVAAGRGPAPHPPQHGHRVGHVQQDQAAEDEVEAAVRDGVGALDVALDVRALVVPGRP